MRLSSQDPREKTGPKDKKGSTSQSKTQKASLRPELPLSGTGYLLRSAAAGQWPPVKGIQDSGAGGI